MSFVLRDFCWRFFYGRAFILGLEGCGLFRLILAVVGFSFGFCVAGCLFEAFYGRAFILGLVAVCYFIWLFRRLLSWGFFFFM